MKRFLSILLALIMLLSLAACGNSSPDSVPAQTEAVAQNAADVQPAETVPAADLEHVELTMAFPYINNAPQDIEAVEAALNKITEEKINASIKIVPISIGAWPEQFNLMMSNSSEKIDLVFSGLNGNSLSSLVSKGYLLELEDLLAGVGAPTKAAVGNYTNGCMVNGSVYAVPTLRDLATSTGVMMLKEYVDKYSIDINAIHDWSDLTPVLETIKAGEGDNFYPFIMNGGQYGNYTATMFGDILSDGFGAYDPATGTLYNLFASEQYKNALELMHSWYEAGYIAPDAETTTATWQEIVLAGKSCIWPNNEKPGQVQNQSNMVDREIVGVKIGTDIVTTASIQTAMWSIPYQASDPERSMMLLNLLYADEEFFNTILWGVEGVHYQKTDDGHITFADGLDASSSGWYINIGWVLGNQFLSYCWEGTDLDIWEQTKAYNDSATLSECAGFVFDTAPVKNEYAACQAVVTEYRRGLETGTKSLAELDAFIGKLEAAGIDKVITEKQNQLNAFMGK